MAVRLSDFRTIEPSDYRHTIVRIRTAQWRQVIDEANIHAPAYLIDELCQVADVEARQRLRSSSSSSMIVSHTRLPTVGDRAFPVAAPRVWNILPDLVTSAPSVAVFRPRLKTHLFNISYPFPMYLPSDSSSCFGHYNRSCLHSHFFGLGLYVSISALQWASASQ